MEHHRRHVSDFSERFKLKKAKIDRLGVLSINTAIPVDKHILKRQIYPDSPFVSSARSYLNDENIPLDRPARRSLGSSNDTP